MRIIDSDLRKHVLKTIKNELGYMHFLNQIAVIEFNEGVHVELNNTQSLFTELKTFFGINKPFGVVANRVNSYSVKLLDIPAFRSQVDNLSAYAVVGHDPAGIMNAAIESNFCLSDDIGYDNIYEAVDSVNNKVKKRTLAS
ncbi:hypothetical protein PK35_01645 [Tamlana nanhaiensis]|uniref:Uncharacterized protein n=1 Tax=Neotamlana nanhaiensis TaxID=1382798 RepID=A0A0D7W5X6_9FLAO|nr:hypothetical protein [Tamlana nanhaiensis]KJD34520.1 hypothetical protein PK35_01645 [Tamlana nanhaiensis]